MSSPSPTRHGDVRRRPSSGPVTRDEGRRWPSIRSPKKRFWSDPRAPERVVGSGKNAGLSLPDVPDVVIQRLPLYLRALSALPTKPGLVVTSMDLSAGSGVSPAQIRKDLSFFSPIGHPGRGYEARQLAGALRRILGVDRRWQVLVYGAGRLGRSLVTHGGFGPSGFHIAAIVDADPMLVGEQVGALTIHSASALARVVRTFHVEIGIAAVPVHAAQAAADAMVEAGIHAILNYAPVSLQVPQDVAVREIDPVVVLQSMTFYLHAPSPETERDAQES